MVPVGTHSFLVHGKIVSFDGAVLSAGCAFFLLKLIGNTFLYTYDSPHKAAHTHTHLYYLSLSHTSIQSVCWSIV